MMAFFRRRRQPRRKDVVFDSRDVTKVELKNPTQVDNNSSGDRCTDLSLTTSPSPQVQKNVSQRGTPCAGKVRSEAAIGTSKRTDFFSGEDSDSESEYNWYPRRRRCSGQSSDKSDLLRFRRRNGTSESTDPESSFSSDQSEETSSYLAGGAEEGAEDLDGEKSEKESSVKRSSEKGSAPARSSVRDSTSGKGSKSAAESARGNTTEEPTNAQDTRKSKKGVRRRSFEKEESSLSDESEEEECETESEEEDSCEPMPELPVKKAVEEEDGHCTLEGLAHTIRCLELRMKEERLNQKEFLLNRHFECLGRQLQEFERERQRCTSNLQSYCTKITSRCKAARVTLDNTNDQLGTDCRCETASKQCRQRPQVSCASPQALQPTQTASTQCSQTPQVSSSSPQTLQPPQTQTCSAATLGSIVQQSIQQSLQQSGKLGIRNYCSRSCTQEPQRPFPKQQELKNDAPPPSPHFPAMPAPPPLLTNAPTICPQCRPGVSALGPPPPPLIRQDYGSRDRRMQNKFLKVYCGPTDCCSSGDENPIVMMTPGIAPQNHFLGNPCYPGGYVAGNSDFENNLPYFLNGFNQFSSAPSCPLKSLPMSTREQEVELESTPPGFDSKYSASIPEIFRHGNGYPFLISASSHGYPHENRFSDNGSPTMNFPHYLKAGFHPEDHGETLSDDVCRADDQESKTEGQPGVSQNVGNFLPHAEAESLSSRKTLGSPIQDMEKSLSRKTQKRLSSYSVPRDSLVKKQTLKRSQKYFPLGNVEKTPNNRNR